MMTNSKYLIFMFLSICLMASCSEDEPAEIKQDSTPFILDYGAFTAPEIAADNPLTIQGVELGRMLFYETLLSKDNTQSCASCHRQADGFSDSLRFSIGVEGLMGGRQAMPVFNLAWHDNEFFWDGRAHLLRDQSIKPIQDELEMNETLENCVKKLTATKAYRDQFKRVFGSEEITSEKMSLALEQFMNSIVSNDSKYDQFLANKVTLTESEVRGRQLFELEYNPFFPLLSGADCVHCHSGDNFTNNKYMNNGLDVDADITDLGRAKVTELDRDKGAFKVPSLRNIEVTAPYMHDGRFTTLEEVVDHYNNGLQESASLDPALQAQIGVGLKLTAQNKTDLVNFLKTLTDYTYLTNPAYASPF